MGRPVLWCIALGAFAPILANFLAWNANRSLGFNIFAVDPSDYPLALALIVVTVGMLIAGWAGLKFVDDRSDELDLTLPQPEQRDRLERFVHVYFHYGVQIGIVVVFDATLVIWMQVWAVTHGHEFSLGGWICALWTVTLGALCLHWCLPLPVVFDGLLRPASRPYLVPFDPASTPWVKILARVISLGGGLVAALATLAGILNATLTLTRRPVDPDTVSSLASEILPAVTLLLIAVAIWFWVIPAWQLTSIVTDAKRRRLAAIEAEARKAEKAKVAEDFAQRLARIEEYRLISSAPDTPISSQSVAQYIALAGALVGALLSPLLRVFFGIEV